MDPLELTQEKMNKKDNKENESDRKLVCDDQQTEIETVRESRLEIESKNEKTSEIESVSEKLIEIIPVCDDEANLVNAIRVEGNKSTTRNTILPVKSNSLFDDDDNDLFSSKCEKSKKTSSNIFDSDDDEFEFTRKFTKKDSVKTKSIFGDDSDDDLFATPSNKPSASNLLCRKPNDKTDRRQNRSDGYVKLAAESVAVNPLDES